MTREDLVKLLDYWEVMEGTHYCYPHYDHLLDRLGLSEDGLQALKWARDELAKQKD